MGSRGLSFAALCAELLVARLHGEPLPVEQRLADALLPQYGGAPEKPESPSNLDKFKKKVPVTQ